MTEAAGICEPLRLFEPKVAIAPRLAEPPTNSRMLMLVRSEPGEARRYIAAWHSRLPNTQRGPWRFAFVAVSDAGDVYAAALWHNPSARGLPQDWLELRRLACAPDAPHCTASWMLGRMARWFKQYEPQCPGLLSYQDTAVHTGTIYRAAGWTPVFVSKGRDRDRSSSRRQTGRSYRTNLNGHQAAAAPKVRWEKRLGEGGDQQADLLESMSRGTKTRGVE